MKKHLIPAIFFSVCALVFGTWFIIERKSLVGPIMNGVSAIYFWISFYQDLKNPKISKGRISSMFLRINTRGLKQVYYNEEKDLVLILQNGTSLIFSNTELVQISSDVNGLILEISEKT